MQQPCPHCGAYVRARASFCGICGKTMPAQTVLPTAIAQQAKMPSAAACLLATDGRQYALKEQVTRVGRSSQCSLQLPDESVSGIHAEIEARGGGFVIRDLGSTNGTYINNVEVRGQAPLNNGDQVAFGYATFTFQSKVQALHGLSPAQPLVPIGHLQAPAPAPISPPVAPWAAPGQPGPGLWQSPVVQPPVPLQVWRDWGNRPPAVEGKIVHIDGPHKEQKSSVAGTAVAAGCLAIVFTPFMFIPFLFNRDVSVYYLRVEDVQSSQHRSVKVRGEPSGMVSQGDIVAFWGRFDGGTLLVKKAYNYNTDAFVKVK